MSTHPPMGTFCFSSIEYKIRVVAFSERCLLACGTLLFFSDVLPVLSSYVYVDASAQIDKLDRF